MKPTSMGKWFDTLLFRAWKPSLNFPINLCLAWIILHNLLSFFIHSQQPKFSLNQTIISYLNATWLFSSVCFQWNVPFCLVCFLYPVHIKILIPCYSIPGLPFGKSSLNPRQGRLLFSKFFQNLKDGSVFVFSFSASLHFYHITHSLAQKVFNTNQVTE